MAICQAHKLPKTHLESVTGKGDRSTRSLICARMYGNEGAGAVLLGAEGRRETRSLSAGGTRVLGRGDIGPVVRARRMSLTRFRRRRQRLHTATPNIDA